MIEKAFEGSYQSNQYGNRGMCVTIYVREGRHSHVCDFSLLTAVSSLESQVTTKEQMVLCIRSTAEARRCEYICT